MITGFHHAGMATKNLERLTRFYVDLFHGRILHEFSWDEENEALSIRLGVNRSAGRLVMIGFEGARLELFHFETPELSASEEPRSVAKPGISHVCFSVDDCVVEHDRLVAAGMQFHASPLRMPAGGVFAYGRDPDGNVVELLQPAIID